MLFMGLRNLMGIEIDYIAKNFTRKKFFPQSLPVLKNKFKENEKVDKLEFID